jgi:hypothetical protein
MAVQTTEAPAGLPTFKTGQKLQTEPTPFLGQIMKDEWQPGEYGPRWYFTIRPVEYALKGQTGMFHEWIPFSDSERSRFGQAVGLFAETFGKGIPIGEGALVGQRAYFTHRPLTVQGKTYDVWVPVRKATDDDLRKDMFEGGGEEATVGPATASAADYSPDEVAALVSFLIGKTAKEAQRDVIKSNLPAHLKNDVMAGRAVSYLIEQSIMTATEGGRLS